MEQVYCNSSFQGSGIIEEVETEVKTEAVDNDKETLFSRSKRVTAQMNYQEFWQHKEVLCKPKVVQTSAWWGEVDIMLEHYWRSC